jgi:hypothetical protein
LGDYSEGYPEGNPESYPDSYLVSYSEGYPGRNSESCLGSCREDCPGGCSVDCPVNRSGGNPESNPADSRENRPESSWENCLVDCLADCLGDARCRRVNRSDAIRPLPQLDDLGAEAGTCFQNMDAGRERRAGVIPILVAGTKGESRPARPICIDGKQESARSDLVGPGHGVGGRTDIGDSPPVR